ncbi:hypothetical protein [Zavarzinia aquatilis]|uniref:Uncharacterized protein n=1 Tax=Zavarzinia aquatilis TaxID=2211142 RepID=A0A317EEA7_9PROT|nr:hypothetical protein [Zavarzinia aquatilis]PWR24596.1 hypothetical protein DKG74_07260 [Zavarzinia aquatilis]
MMNALQKAVDVIRAQREAHPGLDEIALTRYPDANTFYRLRPGEDYLAHLAQRQALVEWCEAEGLRVINVLVDEAATTAEGRAESALDRRERMVIKGDAYRLGVKLKGGSQERPGAALGWSTVKLGGKPRKVDGGEA